jgi:hypothetical protein
LLSDYFHGSGASYTHMQSAAPIRFFVAASFTFAALLPAQSTPAPQVKPTGGVQVESSLPATPPTTTPEYPLTPSQQPPKRAQVTYANNILAISADNSSLNQILRQISSDAGVKITGGVVDERVFGQYGPAPLAQILAELLDGTSSNMLFTHPDGATSSELILTPRQGGATPPNPNAAAFDDKPDQQEPAPDPQQQAMPAEQLPPGSRTTVPMTPASQTGAAPTDGSQPESPNGVKTPQQIYEQLQRMRQQQQQPTTPP